MNRIIILDNYDSFVYNVYQYIAELDPKALIEVHRNDKITIDEIEKFKPTHLVVSPGPGRPEDAGICIDAIKHFCKTIPILGICLGHQAIGMAFGGKVIHAKNLMHGKVSKIEHTESSMFLGINNPFIANRYHSLVVEEKSLPEDLIITAKSECDEEIMAMQHSKYHVYGLQFHPESILTLEGKIILNNFLKINQIQKEKNQTVKTIKKGAVTSAINELLNKKDLAYQTVTDVMEDIMSGHCSDVEISAFLVALRMKGETGDELAGMAKVMQDKSLHVNHTNKITADTCGTGGDGAGTFNISTCSSFVVAAGGIPIAKHGNRSVSSKVGSADVLESGGYRLQKTVKEIETELKETGFTFMFAPIMHPAMKNVMPVRRELKTRTSFNMLGPITNPSRVKYQVIGVFDFEYAEKIAKALQLLGTERSLIVNGGFTDELTTCRKNKALLVTQEKITDIDIDISTLGLFKGDIKDIEGEEEPQKAFWVMQNVLSGKGNKTMIETVSLNAGALFWITGKTKDLKAGVAKALEIIKSGEGVKKLKEIMDFQNA